MTNALRHGRPQHCAVTLSVDDALRVQVTDDGCGLPAQETPGVGLAAMRERAAELGGTCTISTADGETTVLARLPVVSR
jgi:signal transduction histidine kinase